MNPDPKQLLQIIHNRGEQCWISPVAVDEARRAAQELANWIDAQLAKIEADKVSAQKFEAEMNAKIEVLKSQVQTPDEKQ